jgi:hypothetical protein
LMFWILNLKACSALFLGGWQVGLGCELRALGLQTILLWLFWRWGLRSYLSGLALNSDPPNLSLLSS